jgi:hypothetical protein
MRMLAGRVWRDDGLVPPPDEHLPQASGIIGAISEKSLGLTLHREQAARRFEIADVPVVIKRARGRPISSVQAASDAWASRK